MTNQQKAKQTREAIQAEIQDIFAEKEVRIRMPIEELKVLLEKEDDEEDIWNVYVYFFQTVHTMFSMIDLIFIDFFSLNEVAVIKWNVENKSV